MIILSCSHTFPELGNVFNPSDNEETISDKAFFNFIITALQDSSGTTFRLSTTVFFDNTEEVVNTEAFTQEYNVILPTIEIQASVSTT